MQASSNYKVLLTINKGIQFIKNRAMVIFYARMKHAVKYIYISSKSYEKVIITIITVNIISI